MYCTNKPLDGTPYIDDSYIVDRRPLLVSCKSYYPIVEIWCVLREDGTRDKQETSRKEFFKFRADHKP